MQVILREDIPNLGDAGAIVKVRDGYARNFLLPKRLAVVADADNVKQLEHEQRVVAAQQAKLKSEMETVAKQIAKAAVSFTMEVGEDGKLFGSVTNQDIAAALAEQGVTVDRRRIKLQEPIKAVGEYDLPVRLHAEVQANVKVTVAANNADA